VRGTQFERSPSRLSGEESILADVRLAKFYAQGTSGPSGLHLAGGNETIFTSSLPVALPRGVFAVDLRGQSDEVVVLRLRLVSPKHVDLKDETNPLIVGADGRATAFIDMQGFVVEAYGRHVLEVSVNGEVRATVAMRVARPGAQ
jgi:hypothetical protein